MDISELLEQEPFKEQKEYFEKLLDTYDKKGQLSQDECFEYDAILKAYRDWVNCMSFMLDEALEKKRQREFEIGKREAICEIASNLKKYKVDIPTIIECTGLSAEEIEAL